MITSLAQRRIEAVREHMTAEIAHGFDKVIATFARPRYELFGAGETFDGEADVRRYFWESRTAFPDQGNEVISMRAADDAIIVEFWLTGTHKGPLATPAGALPPTGRTFRQPMCAIFKFEGDKIVCERIYFDRMAILAQLVA
jgi:steroid delta-isomerase-like uncharacterized protein